MFYFIAYVAEMFSPRLVSPAFLFILEQPDPAIFFPFAAHSCMSNRNMNPESIPVETAEKVLQKLVALN